MLAGGARGELFARAARMGRPGCSVLLVEMLFAQEGFFAPV